MYLANNFLRPVKYTKSSQKKDNILQFKRLVFANKYCMVKLMILYDEFYYYNKISNKLFTTKLSNLDTEGIINTLCQKFNFSTTFEDIISIIKYYCSDIENISVELFNE